MSPAAIALCILVPLFLFTLVFVAWVYQEKPQPYRRELSDAEMREGLAALDEMGIRFGDPEELKAKDRGSFK